MLHGGGHTSHGNRGNSVSPHELVTIAPAETEDDDQSTHQPVSSHAGAVSMDSGNQQDVSSQNDDSEGTSYDVPDGIGNLTEVDAPSPDENPHEQLHYRRSFLETTRSRQKEYQQSQKRRSLAEGGPHEGREGEPNGILGRPTKERKEATPGRQRASRLLTETYTLSYLIFFSILGTLARIGLDALTKYPGYPISTSVLWANFTGSLLMGYFSEDRKLFMYSDTSQNGSDPEEEINEDAGNADVERGGTRDSAANKAISKANKIAAKKAHLAFKKTVPLYIGLTTGFCGSFTSFSSFMRDVFLALSNSIPTITSTNRSTSIIPRNGGFSFMALLAVVILTLCACISALKFGAHLAISLHYITPSMPVRLIRRIFDRITVVVAWGMWLGAIFMAIWPPDRPSGPAADGRTTWAQESWRGQVLFALIFAPLGCIARFYASVHMNGLSPSFPVGTFVVNMFGTVVMGMAWNLQHAPLASAAGQIGGGLVGCQVLQGVMDGFCGCLTTVSTWVLELTSLRRRHAYFYGAMSIGVGLAALVVVMGSLKWTRGFADPVCSS